MKDFIIQWLIVLALIGLLSKFFDFIIGKKGRNWLKDKVIVQSWIYLESLSFRSIVNKAAITFDRFITFSFGTKIISLHAYVASFFISALLTLFLIYFPLPDTFYKVHPIHENIPFPRALIIGIIKLWIWNVFLDFSSYAITRKLAKKIVESVSILKSLLYWLVDFICCFIIMAVTFFSFEGIRIAFCLECDRFVTILNAYQISSATSAATLTGSVPTLIHLIFFIVIFVLSILELAKRILAFLLERIDEANESPLTIIAGFSATVVSFFLILYKFIFE